jgi:molybdopterin molybdotransferase
VISVDDALARMLAAANPLGSETVPLAAGRNRALAAPLLAAYAQPPFDASAMDGYAVRSADLARETTLRLVGTAQAGQRFAGMVGPGQCVRIFTGAPLPIGADAVVAQEDVTANGNEIAFGTPVDAGHYVRARGSVFAEGAPLLSAGSVLNPARIGLAALANRNAVTVVRRPRVALLATGDELVPPGSPLGPDQIVDSNSISLSALFGPIAEIEDRGIVRDTLSATEAGLADALESGADLLVTTGGASVGERDYVQEVLRQLGVTIDFWQIAMRPGKPVMFGRRGSTLVFGLPGNPVSALVTATLFVLPVLRTLAGHADPLGPRLALPLAAPLPPNGPRRHFRRARLEPAPSGTQVIPIPETDSAHLASLALADVLIVQPENDSGMPAGAVVEVVPLE